MTALKTIKTERDEFAEASRSILRDALKYAEENPLKSVAVFTLTHAGQYNITYSTFERIELAGALALMGAEIAK